MINADWLKANGACLEGYAAHRKQFPNGATHAATREWLDAIRRGDWSDWLRGKLGGDTATAGDYGTATAGHYGTATARAGGTATAGYMGTATAGDCGCICILFWSGTMYKRRCAEVGDGGLKPNTPYRLNGKGEFVEAR